MPPPPLLELDRALLTHEERVKIFNNVEEIKRCNEALFAALSRDGEPVRTLALAFLELAPYLKLYSHYCACYDGALAELRRKRGASAEFDAFLAAGRSKARGLGVEDFLIKPVQRLTKYPLFFDEVLALLPAEHESASRSCRKPSAWCGRSPTPSTTTTAARRGCARSSPSCRRSICRCSRRTDG